MANAISFGADEDTRQKYARVFDGAAILMGWDERRGHQHQIARHIFDGLHDLMKQRPTAFAQLVGAIGSATEGDADSRQCYCAFLAYVKGLGE